MNLLLMLFAVVLASAAGYVLGRRGAEAHSRVEEPGAPAEIEEPGARAEEPLVEGLRAAPNGVTERTLTSEHTALANPTSAESLGDSITPVEPVVPEPVLVARRGGTEYCYSETPTGLSVTYESESWGFFDDSEHHESGSCRLEHLEHPSAEQLGRAIDVGETKGSEDVCYLRNPFGMVGIFRLERRWDTGR